MKESHREVITLIGKPASGKGTQAEPLAKSLNIPFVSMGKMLRDEIKNKTAMGRKFASYLAAGQLVPYKLSLVLIKRRLAKPDAQKGIVLDGFPRDVDQARAFETIGHITHAIVISVTEKEVMERITGRRCCPVCNRNFHIKINPPKKPGICDACGSHLVHRSDDTAAVVKERLKSYRDDTIPVLHFYRRLRALRRIDGVGTIEEVHQRILDAIYNSDKGINRHAQRNG